MFAKEGSFLKTVGYYEKTGIDVLIVGTGLAGLTAALECYRKGYTVRILKCNATIDNTGLSSVFRIDWRSC